MKNTSSALRIAATFFTIIALFVYGIYSFFIKSQTTQPGIEYENVFLTGLAEKDSTTPQSLPVLTESEQSKDVISVSGAEALGKVVNRTISNSSSNLSAGGVHIRNSTDLDVSISELLSSKLGFTVKKDQNPQVLILHTHATECFLNEDRDYYTAADKTRTTDNAFNVTKLGEIVADKLNSAGITTLHDKTQHDYPSYNESYSRAAKTINGYIKKYPSIKVVIDIHRDSVQTDTTKTKLTAKIDGRPAAQVMLVMGSQSGNVKNFPNWKENLKLAVRLQKNIESMYPNLARPLSLMSRSYNEPLTTGSMLIEIGTEANAFDEAKYSADLLANSLIKTLSS